MHQMKIAHIVFKKISTLVADKGRGFFSDMWRLQLCLKSEHGQAAIRKKTQVS